MTDVNCAHPGTTSIVMPIDNYALTEDEQNGIVSEYQLPLDFALDKAENDQNKLRVLSLFSGCGGMDIGFEGGFIAHKKSFSPSSNWIDHIINDKWIYLKKNRFTTVFANDILSEAQVAWTRYMSKYRKGDNTYHLASIVDLVKALIKEQRFSLKTLM